MSKCPPSAINYLGLQIRITLINQVMIKHSRLMYKYNFADEGMFLTMNVTRIGQ